MTRLPLFILFHFNGEPETLSLFQFIEMYVLLSCIKQLVVGLCGHLAGHKAGDRSLGGLY